MTRRIRVAVILIAGIAIFLVGYGLGRSASPRPSASADSVGGTHAADTLWTCSMHPQIRQPKPGKCPLCGMDLIPLEQDSGTGADLQRQVTLSPAARSLAEVEVAAVERRAVAVEVRMVGKVQFDETRLAYIAPRVPGRIDRLYANFTGMPVNPGDHLADMYSPELVSVQQELLQAQKGSAGGVAFTTLLDATRERLRLWGLTAEQIAEIERSGQVRDHVTFYAPIGGIVVAKEAREGQYVETGMRLFTVADLSCVWVQLDAYESDLAWLRYAQEVTFQVEAYPGTTFSGTVAFIDPLLDPQTRTVKVRVNVPNADGRLKPEMFVRAVVLARVGAGGTVVRPDLRGKWISPMHPEIVKDGPGTCDVCGMPLVRAEALGYATQDDAALPLPLVIPASAPLVTGKRAVVYVASPTQAAAYEGREVVLGPRAGDYYLVAAGLQEGEWVVTKGNFKIDSSLQIQGKPSMMAPAGDAAPAVPPQAGGTATAGSAAEPLVPLTAAVPAAFRLQLDGVLDGVLSMAAALADDDLNAARASAIKAKQALGAVDMSVLAGDAHEPWMQALQVLNPALDTLATARDIEPFRVAFAPLSAAMARIAKTFGPLRADPIYDLHCPMAFDNRGATWLQSDTRVRNPYFGKAMLTCGEVTETIPPAAAGQPAGGPAHE